MMSINCTAAGVSHMREGMATKKQVQQILKQLRFPLLDEHTQINTSLAC